jgi:copper ion binding protein
MMNSTPRTFVGTTTFRVDGMTCDHCVQAVVREVGVVDGVSEVSVDLTSGLATVSTTAPVDRADISAAVDEAGYTLVP